MEIVCNCRVLSSLGQFAFSRVYINFKRFEDVITFRNRFDGFVFFGHGGEILWEILVM